VFDSAKGGTRAPQTFAATVSWREMWSRVSYMAATYILFVCPAGFYHMFTQRTDTIFWALAAWALLFFPMGLLAMVLHDSTSVLNPFFLLVAIFRTFLPYVGLMGLFALLAVLVWLVPRGTEAFVPIDRTLLAVAIGGYGALIVAHILGRFYWRYRKRLDWDL
jgi:hypothetical protein